MSHKSPSRSKSNTPSCPDDPNETNMQSRTISRIRTDVERELENADAILSSVHSLTGISGASSQRNKRPDTASSHVSSQSRRSPRRGSGSQNAEGECPRSTALSFAEASQVEPGYYEDTYGSSAGGAGGGSYGGADDLYGGSGVGGGSPYGNIGADGGGYGGAGGPGDPYGSAGAGGGSYGGAGGPDDPYGDLGADGGGYGGTGGPGDPYGIASAGGGSYGGAGGPGDPYGSAGAGGGSYGGAGGPGDPYGSAGAGGGSYGGAGGPGDPYGSAGAGGGSYGDEGGPGDPYGSAGAGGGSYGGAGVPGDPYGSAGAGGGSYGGAGGPGDPYGSAGAGGGSYGGAGGPDDPYGSAGAGGGSYMGAGGTGDPYGSVGAGGGSYEGTGGPGSRGPTSAQRSRDPSAGYTRGGAPSGILRGTETEGRGSPSSRSGSPSRVQLWEPSDKIRPQYSDARAQSRTAYNSSGSPSSHMRGVSSNAVGGSFRDGMNSGKSVEFESRETPAKGSMGSPGGPTTDSSFFPGTTRPSDQSLRGKKFCPAATNGRCPAYVKDSSDRTQERATPGGSNRRTLGRIEEGLIPQKTTGTEFYGPDSTARREDFNLSGNCQMQAGRPPCPPPIPPRPVGYKPPTYCPAMNDSFQTPRSRPQTVGFAQPPMPPTPPMSPMSPISPMSPMSGRSSAMQHEHHHHGHHVHHDHGGLDGEGFLANPVRERDEKSISALNRLSQLQKTPSYTRCKPERELNLSSCGRRAKDTTKSVKFPEKPCKRIDEIQEWIACETKDVESTMYLTSDEKRTYKKPCPKQQKAQENVKSIMNAQTHQPCGKEYTPLEHPDPDDITPELAASMMFSQEQGAKLVECPDETIKRLFPDMPRPPFPVKLSAVHIDSNQEDQEEIIEKSASVPSEGVSDSAYTRTMQNKGEDIGAQKSYDIDFAIGAEKLEYVLVADKPQRYNKVQFRGNLPSWFPGYMEAFPDTETGIALAKLPSPLFQKAWINASPEKLPASDVVVLD